MPRDEILKTLHEHRANIQAFGVNSLALFGSAARDEMRSDSDVDVLVEFDPPPTFERYMDLKFYLEDLLGCRVDLGTADMLKSRIRDQVQNEALYVARDYRLYLDDILTSSDKILRYTEHLTFDAFVDDNKTFDAVVLNLEIIGEAAKHVPEQVKAKYLEVDWRRIAGLRDVIAHGYFGLNEHVLWDLIQNRVPELRQQIRRILASEG